MIATISVAILGVMPAVTADTATVPTLTVPTTAVNPRAVRSVTTAPEGFEGEGFPVRRAFAGVTSPTSTRSSTWTRWARSTTRPGEPKGTDWHPHRGFETVTYIIDGTFLHQDSHGGGGVITDGATQWMTAGGGILHIETPPEELVISGGLFHGIQLWVNLPAKDKMVAPALPEPRGRARSRCCRRPTAARSCASSPATSAATRARARRTRRSSSPTPRSPPAPGSSCPGEPTFNALAYVLAGRGTRRRRAGAGRDRPARGVRGGRHAHARRPTGNAAARGAAARRRADPASRSRSTARS